MTNWENILQQAKSHGNFAGRSQAEQDAYFEFFAGAETGKINALASGVHQAANKLHKFMDTFVLRRRPFGVASSQSTASN